MISARDTCASVCVVISTHAIGNPAATQQGRLFVALLRSPAEEGSQICPPAGLRSSSFQVYCPGAGKTGT